MGYTSLAALRTVQQLQEHLDSLDLDLPCDDAILTRDTSPLAEPVPLSCGTAGNRWCIQPMEGADASPDGAPTADTTRRWERFGRSGAKLIWGGEAVAIRPDGRTNPQQLLLHDATLTGLEALRTSLVMAHTERFGDGDDLIVGLQLAHAGRWARPQDLAVPAPRAAFRHPILDARAGVDDDRAVLTDAEVAGVIESFVKAAVDAQEMGFAFVDVMLCHGHLLHEFLGAYSRPGPYGGAWENRTAALREIIAGVRRDAPGLAVGARISAYDSVPFHMEHSAGVGVPEPYEHLLPYEFGFGMNRQQPTLANLDESHALLDLLAELDVELVNVSAGSPHYTVHIQRPAYYAAAGEYAPPEDPLLGVVRLLHAARDLKYHHPDAIVVGSGFSCLQDYLPHVAQAVVRENWVDFVGTGRMALTYPDLPVDVLERGRLDRARVCRTFGACTASTLEGRVSGCYPQDEHFAALPDTAHLRERR